MDAAKKQRLVSAGVDVDGAFERFMDNEQLYNKFLLKFVESTGFSELEGAISAADWEQALTVSHNLKGMTGSLGFVHLYELLCAQVERFRRGDNASAAALMGEILPEYRRFLELAGEFTRN